MNLAQIDEVLEEEDEGEKDIKKTKKADIDLHRLEKHMIYRSFVDEVQKNKLFEEFDFNFLED